MSSVQLDDLPVEIFEQITKYLSLKECVRIEPVSSKWRNLMRKEWRRLKIVSFRNPIFSRMIDNRIKKSNDSADVNLVTVCLQELAVKIHSNVQEVRIDQLDNRHVLAFLKKLCQLSTPKLRALTFDKYCKGFNESDAKIMADIAQCIPLTLKSLELFFYGYQSNATKYFCDGFNQRTFTQLKSLCIDYSLSSSFRIDALQTPNLEKLTLSVGRVANENVFDIDNLDQLTSLEVLRLNYSAVDLFGSSETAVDRSLGKTLETVTSNYCKFLQTLKKLYLDGDCTDEQLLSQIGRFSALEWLKLPLMEGIDTAGQLRIVRSIGQGCAHLKSLYFCGEVEDEVILEVADGFQNLCDLNLHRSSVQQIETFVNRLSVDRSMEIDCVWVPTEAKVQASAILNSHPNIRYTCLFDDNDDQSD